MAEVTASQLYVISSTIADVLASKSAPTRDHIERCAREHELALAYGLTGTEMSEVIRSLRLRFDV